MSWAGPNALSEAASSASRIAADIGLSFFMVHAGWPEAKCKFTVLQASKALPRGCNNSCVWLWMHLPTCGVCVAVTPHVRCEDCRRGARPMNTATVYLLAGRVRSKCARRLGSLWTVPGENVGQRFSNRRGTDQLRRLGPRCVSEIDETHQATAQCPWSARQHDSLWDRPAMFQAFAWFDVASCLCNLRMLGCCARLHVWAPRSPRCLSGGLHPNRLLDAHFKKRENEHGRGVCTYSTIVMQSHHPISFMKFVHGLDACAPFGHARFPFFSCRKQNR